MTCYYVKTWQGWIRIPTIADVAFLVDLGRVVRLGCENCSC
jgi:hypothetical protein